VARDTYVGVGVSHRSGEFGKSELYGNVNGAPITSMSPSKPPFKEITVLSTLALKGALQDTVQDLRVEYHATQALLKSIAEGASADV